MSKKLKIIVIILIIPLFLISCKGPDGKYKFGGDARKSPANPEERVKKNLEEGRGFRLMDGVKKRISRAKRVTMEKSDTCCSAFALLAVPCNGV